MSDLKPLWICPDCGAPLVTRNLWHSCGTWDLDHHFAHRPTQVRVIFDRFREIVEACGPVTLVPQKTRIVFVARVRFSGCVVRTKWLNISLWMMHRIEGDPRVVKETAFNRGTYYHQLRIADRSELDEQFVDWVAEAYRVGCQHHLLRSERPGP